MTVGEEVWTTLRRLEFRERLEQGPDVQFKEPSWLTRAKEQASKEEWEAARQSILHRYAGEGTWKSI